MQVIRSARLDLPIDLPAFESEVRALQAPWVPHFQTAHYEGGWDALPLRSIDGRIDSFLPFPLGGGPANYASTPLLAGCPAIARFLAALRCPVNSARLLNLRAGAIIKPHCDAELSFEKGEARLHVPILTNPQVEFFIEEERIPMTAGSCWYINANLTHRVANRSPDDRIHLVVDCIVDDWLREVFARAEQTHATVRRDPAELRAMIAQFRTMNLPAARDLIAKLEEELADAV